jgi:thymidylate kinase
MGEDLYDSFVRYQGRIIEELDALARDFDFHTLDATRDVDDVADELGERVTRQLVPRVAGQSA